MPAVLVSSYTRSSASGLTTDDLDAFYQKPFFPSVLRGISGSQHQYAIQIKLPVKMRKNGWQPFLKWYTAVGWTGLFLRRRKRSSGSDGLRRAILPILGKSFSFFIPLVDNDNIQAGFDATEYFIKKRLPPYCLSEELKSSLDPRPLYWLRKCF